MRTVAAVVPDWSGMSLVSINDVLKITTRVEEIHPYKVAGDRDSYSPYNEGWSDCVSQIEHYLEQIPSAESERKKGKWIKHENPTLGQCLKIVYECSECHKGVGCEYFVRRSFCPNCGADMRGEQ